MKFFVNIKSGDVKSEKQMGEMFRNPRTKRNTVLYYEADSISIKAYPRRARRAFARKEFQARFGKRKF